MGDMNLRELLKVSVRELNQIFFHYSGATGLLFPDSIEAAYTAFQFIVALGLVVGYSVSQYLCMLTKLYTVGIFAVLGMTSFVILKWLVSRESVRH